MQIAANGIDLTVNIKNPKLPNNAPQVIENILQRKKYQRVPLEYPFPDGKKIAIVVEGGAMRGIISGGALIGLEALGLSAAFDVVYGTSAGAINATYFLTQQAAFGGTIYYQNLCNKRFINFWRFTRMVDVAYLVHHVMVKEKPLWLERLRECRTPLLTSTTDIETGENVFFSSKKAPNPTDILDYLLATAAVPGYYNVPIEIEGRKYLDGLASNPIPISRALEDGCTDILVLLTRPAGFRASPRGVTHHLDKILLRKLPRPFREAYFSRHEAYNKALDMCIDLKDVPREVRIFVICPASTDFMVSNITRDPHSLKRAAAEGIARTLDAFGVHFDFIAECLSVLSSKEAGVI